MAAIQDQKKLDLKNKNLLLTDIEKAKQTCYLEVDSYFEDAQKKIKKYFDKKALKLKFSPKERDNLFVNEKEIDKKLECLSNDQLSIINEQGLKFRIEFDFTINQDTVDASFKQLFRLGGGSITASDPYTCCCVTNEGFYHFSFNETKKLFLLPNFEPVAKACDLQLEIFTLDRDIDKYIITDNYIFGIDTRTKSLVFSRKPFDTLIYFEEVDSAKTSSLRAIEDIYGQTYILCFSIENRECKFFINRIHEWSILNCKDVGCILNTGYPIVKTCDNKLIMLEKRTGLVLKSIECPENSFMYDFSPYGILMTSESEKYKSDTVLFLYNYDLHLIKKIAKFKRARILGTSKMNIFCIYFIDDKRYRFYEFK
ncbi:unnamed protein product [Dimorphilus gyrociliatus]|uniref:Uncharacterized protein n=1 Tax=Dimorphilus gyrociliatus TaxID=2664684 RepID=A0A7I8VJ75_9ANNE|nr:unnamed protein product [Dimorphilus gyrociliatus]